MDLPCACEQNQVQPIVLHDLVQIKSPQKVLTNPPKEKYSTITKPTTPTLFKECGKAQDICVAFKVCFVPWCLM
ncbi:hypothetical protein B7P43_G11532 [Cryptotermes secundus]|uniref:Uncharacterized protein n=1 Tax=Cryptotermes secundus TaxID=105785 RepID=A0A2J7Q9M5_9NEOP|nr:hypothetical protein B7P43_G11532 [Cryptotermes secundus]